MSDNKLPATSTHEIKEVVLSLPTPKINIDDILNKVSNKDLELMGIKLNELTNLVQSVELTPSKRSNLPVIGRFVDYFNQKKNEISVQFANTNTQIAMIVDEIDGASKKMEQTNQELDLLFEDTINEHKIVGETIEQGFLMLKEYDKLIDELQREYAVSPNPLLSQTINDKMFERASLEKRLSDYRILQTTYEQFLPSIRIAQNGNRLLMDKYQTAKLITLPAWKNQMFLAITLQEQAHHADVAKKIDKTTNELMRSNADMMYKNAVEVSILSQSPIVDSETLMYSTKKLTETVRDIQKTQVEGQKNLKTMIDNLDNLLKEKELQLIHKT